MDALTGLTALNRAFWTSLTHPPRLFTNPESATPDAEEGALSVLRQVDAEQLARVSHELTQGIARGAIGGVALKKHFAGSISRNYGPRHDAAQKAVAAFLRSRHSTDIDMLGLRRGRSIIEAFAEFLLDHDDPTGDNRVLIQSEFLSALLKTLAKYPEPGFLVSSPFVRRAGQASWVGYLDVGRVPASTTTPPDAPVVHLSCRGRYMSGPLSTLLLAVLLCNADHPPDWVSNAIRACGSGSFARATRALRDKGMLQ